MAHILQKRGATYVVAFFAAIFIVIGIALPALASPSLKLSPDSGLPGTNFIASGGDFIPGTVVSIRWGSRSGPVLATAPVGVGGEFSANVSVPSGAEAGKTEVWACGALPGVPNTCEKEFVRKSADFVVHSPPTTTTSTTSTTTTTVPTTTSTTSTTTTTVPSTTTTRPPVTTTTARAPTTTKPGTTPTTPGATTSTTISLTSLNTAPPSTQAATTTTGESSTTTQLPASVQGIQVTSEPASTTSSSDPGDSTQTRDGSTIELGGTMVAAGEATSGGSGLAILFALGLALAAVLAIGYARNWKNRADPPE